MNSFVSQSRCLFNKAYTERTELIYTYKYSFPSTGKLYSLYNLKEEEIFTILRRLLILIVGYSSIV